MAKQTALSAKEEIIVVCPVCRKADAQYDPYYGWIPCRGCQDRQSKLNKPDKQIEFIPERIREDRKAHLEDFLPPHRSGKLDKGFVQRYGKKAAKDRGFSDKEIKQATNVWNSEKYYND